MLRASRLPLVVVPAGAVGEFDAAIAEIVRQGAGAPIVGADPFFLTRRKTNCERAARFAIPAVCAVREWVAAVD
jgi:hypothetical protein